MEHRQRSSWGRVCLGVGSERAILCELPVFPRCSGLKPRRVVVFQVTGGVQGEVRLWEMRSRELVSDFKEHSMAVTQVLLYDDDVHAISCSRDKSFLCWDLRVRLSVRLPSVISLPLVCFCPCVVLQREKRISSHTQSMGGINAIALTPDQSLVISAGQDKRLTCVYPFDCVAISCASRFLRMQVLGPAREIACASH